MTTQRIRSTVAASLLSALVLLTAAVPAPGAQAPVLDAQRLTAAADGVRVLVTGAFDDVEAGVARVGGDVLGRLPLVDAVVADVPADAVDDLGRVPGVGGVTENAPVQLQSMQSDAEAHPADSSGPETLRADKLWKDGIDGSGVGIAVLDTGVTEVQDLAGRVREGVDLTLEQDERDNYGHGTPIASAAAGDGAASGGQHAGVAPGAHIVPVKIAGRDGVTDITRVLVGLDWIARHAESHDIGVVNISLGATPVALDLVDAAVQRLWDLGLVVVVAAGNDGPETLGTPAANTHAITVGATQARDTKNPNDDAIAPWSANGVDADGNAKPDLVAPGQSLVLAGAPGSWGYQDHPEGHLGDGYQRVSGTSFSTGLISGAAALALDANPTWTPDEVLGQFLAEGWDVAGTDARTPRLDKMLRADAPVAANGEASDSAAMDALLELGPADPTTLLEMVGDEDLALAYGSGWYGSGWYGSGWYETDWFGSGWYGSGWYGSGWYGSGWYGSGWYELSPEGSGWYDEGSGWYGSGWYGSGWYGSGWYASGWY